MEIGLMMKIRKLEKELEKRREELRKEVKAEFTKQKEIELRKQIFDELTDGLGRKKDMIDLIPHNEQGVILLFGKYYDYLGFHVLDIHRISPDCLAEKDGKEVKIEFEYASSNFITHAHNPKECDLVICWLKDIELPVQTLELKSVLAQFIKA